jgi:putative tryptophan/tyrosine transport system substrate-binding protein
MKKAAVVSILVAVVLLALGVIAEAQQPKKVPRIGYLSIGDPATESTRTEAFRLALRELGYIEGQNVAFEYRYGEGKLDRLAELAAGLVRLKVDLIVASGGSPVIRPAMNATKTIPIVSMGQGTDPVRAGHVESLARPGGNVTGLTALGRELGGKRLELLKEAVPKIARVGLLRGTAISPVLKEIRPAAVALRLKLEEIEAQSGPTGLEDAFLIAKQKRVDAIIPTASDLLN